jgi:hypothetical protein
MGAAMTDGRLNSRTPTSLAIGILIGLAVLVGIVFLPSRSQEIAGPKEPKRADREQRTEASKEPKLTSTTAPPKGSRIAESNTVEEAARATAKRLLNAQDELDKAFFNPSKDSTDFRSAESGSKAARAFESFFHVAGAWMREFFSTFEVATTDGRLIVNVTDKFQKFGVAWRRPAMKQIAKLWEDTAYTREHGFSKAVEFRGPNGWRETVKP